MLSSRMHKLENSDSTPRPDYLKAAECVLQARGTEPIQQQVQPEMGAEQGEMSTATGTHLLAPRVLAETTMALSGNNDPAATTLPARVRFSSFLQHSATELCAFSNAVSVGWAEGSTTQTPQSYAERLALRCTDYSRSLVMFACTDDGDEKFAGRAQVAVDVEAGRVWCPSFAIGSEFRGLGYGKLLARQMLQVALDPARSPAYSNMTIDYYAYNVHADKLYRSVGFKPTGRYTHSLSLPADKLPPVRPQLAVLSVSGVKADLPFDFSHPALLLESRLVCLLLEADRMQTYWSERGSRAGIVVRKTRAGRKLSVMCAFGTAEDLGQLLAAVVTTEGQDPANAVEAANVPEGSSAWQEWVALGSIGNPTKRLVNMAYGVERTK
ncbi:hypothetical protein HDU88_003431 [Geranomyces variabilis]|nr:hypothetical protein HDU88_003431 [Geranomyces variabilis]